MYIKIAQLYFFTTGKLSAIVTGGWDYKIGTKHDFLPQNLTSEELEQILYDNYEIIEVAPEHKIFFMG